MGKLTFNLTQFQESARTYRKELLHLPIIGIQDSLKFMTGVPDVRYEQVVGQSASDAQFAPYKAGQRTSVDLTLTLRTLHTYFGSVNADFEPNAEIQTILGHKASQAIGDAQIGTVMAHEVLGNIAKSLGGHLNDHLWDAKRDANGKTTADLFDGFDTITAAEITAGNISAEKGNYIELSEAITKENAVDVLKSILYSMDANLRKEDCFMFVPIVVADFYNEAYKMESQGILYNKEFNQVYLEGSNRKVTIVPLANKEGSDFIHVTTKRNMLVGYDGVGDVENVQVKEYGPDVLTYCAKMFFGCQFESVDKRRLMVAKIKKAA